MNTELRIAVIGAGPAGVYSSDIFLRQLKKLGEELGLGTEARIDLFEKLPVPFGLVRYGVAPDHPSIKFIASALEKTLDNPNIHLYCDVEFGKDVTLDDLLARYDAVLFATGAVKDKPLNLPGADLEGVYGAAKFVEWYDGYPTGAREWPLTAENVAVIGGGNVAMDVARELMRNADDLKAKTDIPDNVYEGIGQNKAKVLHLFIRRGVAQAKFSVQELREMEKLPGVQLIINEDDFDLDDETIEVAGKDKLTRQMVEELFAIREMAEDMEDDGDVDFEGNPADRKYYVHFNSAPTEILGEDGKVKAIRVERTETGADGKMHRTGEFTDYPVEAVYHAIGYKPAEAPGIAYDEHGAHLANANGDGRITTEADGGEVRDRLYATGWAKRGPVGLIGSTKSDALAIVTNMLEEGRRLRARRGRQGRPRAQEGHRARPDARARPRLTARPRPSGIRPPGRAPCGRGRARGRTGRANMGHCAWRISSNHSACDFSVCIMDAKVRVHGHFNGLKTTLLFALMWAIIMLIWWATGGSRQTLSIYIVIGLITTFGTYWFSDKLAIASMGAREVSEQEAPEIYQIVRELSAKAGKPMPRIYIAPTMSPNAFATGRNERHAAVCCTQGILQILNARELRGVLGHELMHVYNHDILTSAIASAMATVISYLGYSLMYFGGGSRDDRDSSGGLGLIGALLSVILAPIAASLIQMAISRTREYDADEDGSLLTGDPEALASALNKISYGAQTAPMRKTAGTQSVSAMMIANPFSAVGFSRLFSTHPPTDERIARLMQMANEMNGTPIAPPTYSTRVGR